MFSGPSAEILHNPVFSQQPAHIFLKASPVPSEPWLIKLLLKKDEHFCQSNLFYHIRLTREANGQYWGHWQCIRATHSLNLQIISNISVLPMTFQMLTLCSEQIWQTLDLWPMSYRKVLEGKKRQEWMARVTSMKLVRLCTRCFNRNLKEVKKWHSNYRGRMPTGRESREWPKSEG